MFNFLCAKSKLRCSCFINLYCAELSAIFRHINYWIYFVLWRYLKFETANIVNQCTADDRSCDLSHIALNFAIHILHFFVEGEKERDRENKMRVGLSLGISPKIVAKSKKNLLRAIARRLKLRTIDSVLLTTGRFYELYRKYLLLLEKHHCTIKKTVVHDCPKNLDAFARDRKYNFQNLMNIILLITMGERVERAWCTSIERPTGITRHKWKLSRASWSLYLIPLICRNYLRGFCFIEQGQPAIQIITMLIVIIPSASRNIRA